MSPKFRPETSGGPIVIGSLYNGEDKPPYTLPAGQTITTIKSNSSKGGGGSNEIQFEDKKGSEEIYFHGTRDLRTIIEHDRYETIGNNQSLAVGGNQTETVGRAQSLTVGAGLSTVNQRFDPKVSVRIQTLSIVRSG